MIEEKVDNPEDTSLIEEVLFTPSLKEATFDDEAKTATVNIIKEGWSKNFTDGKQRYYTGQAVTAISELLKTSRKMYLTHSKTNDDRMEKWTATCSESWIEDEGGKKVCKAKIDFTENPATVWIYHAAKKYPEEVGLSIDGSGRIRTGKVAGKDAAIVEDIMSLKSTDFVSNAAAGGGVVRVAASADENAALYVLNEAIKSFDDILKDMEKRHQPYVEFNRTMEAFQSFMYDLIYTSEYKPEEIDKGISTAVKSFGEKLKGCVTKIKTKEEVEQENKEGKMDLETLKKDFPELVVKIQEEVKATVEVEDEKSKKLMDAEKKVKDLETQLNDVQTKFTEAETKVAQYLAIEKANEKAQKINEILKANNVQDKVTEDYIKNLNKLDVEVAEVMVKEFSEFLKKNEGKVIGFGPTPKDLKEEKKDKPELEKVNYGSLIKGKKE